MQNDLSYNFKKTHDKLIDFWVKKFLGISKDMQNAYVGSPHMLQTQNVKEGHYKSQTKSQAQTLSTCEM